MNVTPKANFLVDNASRVLKNRLSPFAVDSTIARTFILENFDGKRFLVVWSRESNVKVGGPSHLLNALCSKESM